MQIKLGCVEDAWKIVLYFNVIRPFSSCPSLPKKIYYNNNIIKVHVSKLYILAIIKKTVRSAA